jgi:MFS family permease
MACFETLYYSALTPLLPSFSADLELSKAQVGLLVAAYAVGLSLAAIPVGMMSARVGVKESALGGLAVLAVTSIAFGAVNDYAALVGIRLVQGAAGAACWASGLAWLVDAAPRERRGALIGLFVSAGAAGQIIGPAVGALAQVEGRLGVFIGLAGLASLLAVLGARHPGPTARVPFSLGAIRAAHTSGPVLASQVMVGLPGFLLGTIGVLGPLKLSRLGFGPTGIAATFLVAAAVGVLGRPPIGRWADRHGSASPTRTLLLAAIPVTLAIPVLESRWALSCFVIAAVGIYGLLWPPVMSHLSATYEKRGVAQAQGFALMNLSAGVGIVLGAAGGSEVAHVAGDGSAYALIAATCLLAFAANLALEHG